VVGAALALLSMLAAVTAVNANLSGPPRSWLARFVDRLAFHTRKGAENEGWSWPLVARSAFRAAMDASAPAPAEQPAPPPNASGGYAEAAVLRWVAAVSVAALGALWLAGCPMNKPDGCTPATTRCSPSGVPETCSTTQRWSHAPPASPCSQRGPSVCCWTRSPWGRELYGCALPSACLAEPARDAGAEVSDAQ
jgi:hypothetical protein